MKTCFKCKQELPLEEFYRHSQMSDGRLGKCKSCAKADVKANRDEKAEYYREYDRKRAMLPHRVAGRKNYISTDIGKEAVARAHRKQIEKFPQKYKARTITGNAIRDGKLFKESCSKCGSEKNIHAHHDDYAKPLNVRWFCSVCHRLWHKVNGEGLNGANNVNE